MNQRGFTLIEIMIAMAILAVISILSAQAMRAGIQDRESVSMQIASDSKVSDAIRIMRTDVNAAFHYRDIFVAIQNNAQKPDPKPTPGGTPDPSKPTPPPGPLDESLTPQQQQQQADAQPTPRPTPPEITGFIGTNESLYFTTLSNERTLQDSQVSDQAKVGYFIKSCRSRSGKKTIEDKCLFRSTTPYLDEEVEKGGEETVLLEHVAQFKLRYLGPSKTASNELEYVDGWKTGKTGDDFTKDKFPYAVEVTIVTEDKNDPKSKKVTASSLIPIQFPNNPPKKDPAKPGDPATPADDSSFNPGLNGGKN